MDKQKINDNFTYFIILIKNAKETYPNKRDWNYTNIMHGLTHICTYTYVLHYKFL